MVKNKKAFTLVELLAVILVIAVPSIMSTITESRKGVLASSAKLIASSAETAYISNQTLGIEKTLTCQDVSNYNETEDYTCDLQIVDGKAKVTLIGQGKFEGMAVCGGTKDEAIVKMKNSCPAAPVSFSTDSWETISEAVKAGNTSKYNVGDTRKETLTGLGEHTLRIANNSHYGAECTTTSQTACGFVIEFADIIPTHKMNDTPTNAGGWPGSQMYDYINVTEETGSGTIYNSLPEELRNAIIDTTVVSSHGSGDTSNYTSEDKLYLLSPEEVYGTCSYDTSVGTSRQLDWYIDNGVTISNYYGVIKKNSRNSASWWWLRSAYSDTSDVFYGVNIDGSSSSTFADFLDGVSPAFRLG